MKYKHLELGMIVQANGYIGIVTEVMGDGSASVAWYEDGLGFNPESWWTMEELEIIADPARPYREEVSEKCYITYPDGVQERVSTDFDSIVQKAEEWCEKNEYTIIEDPYWYLTDLEWEKHAEIDIACNDDDIETIKVVLKK